MKSDLLIETESLFLSSLPLILTHYIYLTRFFFPIQLSVLENKNAQKKKQIEINRKNRKKEKNGEGVGE